MRAFEETDRIHVIANIHGCPWRLEALTHIMNASDQGRSSTRIYMGNYTGDDADSSTETLDAILNTLRRKDIFLKGDSEEALEQRRDRTDNIDQRIADMIKNGGADFSFAKRLAKIRDTRDEILRRFKPSHHDFFGQLQADVNVGNFAISNQIPDSHRFGIFGIFGKSATQALMPDFTSRTFTFSKPSFSGAQILTFQNGNVELAIVCDPDMAKRSKRAVEDCLADRHKNYRLHQAEPIELDGKITCAVYRASVVMPRPMFGYNGLEAA